jgi:hypothetical protein
MIAADGNTRFIERNFDAEGNAVGEVAFEFRVQTG